MDPLGVTSFVEVFLLFALLVLLCVILLLRPCQKVGSFDLVSHLTIYWQVVLSEPSLTKVNDFLGLIQHKDVGNHCLHMLLLPRLRSTWDPEILNDRVFFLAEQQMSQMLDLPLQCCSLFISIIPKRTDFLF